MSDIRVNQNVCLQIKDKNIDDVIFEGFMDGSEDQGSRARQVEYDQGVHRLPRRDHEQHQLGRVIQRTLHQQLAILP
jgi:hypothetical protein